MNAHKRTAALLVREVDAKHGKRISHCGLVAHADKVTLQKVTGPDGKVRGAFAGLVSCNSVWCCPACSSRISETRRGEANAVLSWARAQGHSAVMLTLTARHDRKTALSPFVDDLKAAIRALRQSSGWSALGLVGSIAATEVTFGAQGWHPHGHLVLIVPASAGDPLAAVERLRARWSACLEKRGRDCNAAGFQVQDARAAGAYLAKWGAAEELTLAGSKRARSGSRTPFQLLADASEKDDRQAARLFQEFAVAFKGKAQLHFSRGLKVLAGIGEKSDDECEPEGERVAVRSWPGKSRYWREARRRRAALLDAVETGGNLDAAEFGLSDAARWRKVRDEGAVIEPEVPAWVKRSGKAGRSSAMVSV